MYDEILSSIDNIDECVMEAEMNVLTAMINEYDKAIMIMENYNGDSYDCFDIFQEGFNDELNKPVFGVKGENILKRILMAIPRLIAMLVKKVKKFFNKEKSERIVKNLETIKRVKVKDLNKNDLDKGSDSLEINNMVEDLVEKKVINTNLKFDVIFQYLNDCFDVDGNLHDLFCDEYNDMSVEERDNVDNINAIIKKMDEYWRECQNKPCMQHKSEADVLTYITSPDEQEYDINGICKFISNVDFCLHRWSALDINKLKQDLSDEINSLNEKHGTGTVTQINAYIHKQQLDIKITKQILIVVPIVAKIVDEEFDKWDEATKKAVGLLNDED